MLDTASTLHLQTTINTVRVEVDWLQLTCLSDFMFLKFPTLLLASPRLLYKLVASPRLLSLRVSWCLFPFSVAMPEQKDQIPKRLAVIDGWKSKPEYIAAMQKIQAEGLPEINDPVPSGCSRRAWETRMIVWKRTIRELVQSTGTGVVSPSGTESHAQNLDTGIASATTKQKSGTGVESASGKTGTGTGVDSATGDEFVPGGSPSLDCPD